MQGDVPAGTRLARYANGLANDTERGFVGMVGARGKFLDDVAVDIGERLGHSKYLCRGFPAMAYSRELAFTSPSLRARPSVVCSTAHAITAVLCDGRI